MKENLTIVNNYYKAYDQILMNKIKTPLFKTGTRLYDRKKKCNLNYY